MSRANVGKTESCGCVALRRRAEAAAQRIADRQRLVTERRAARAQQGTLHRTPTYATWTEMIKRCTLDTHPDYKNYGGRGITMCDRWRVFENFLADMGERPHGTTIDRRNNDGNYEPSNCRWATATEQNRNSRHCKLTLDLAREAMGRLEMGEGPSAIGRRLGVTGAMIAAIRDGRAWRELQPFRPARGA
jgi:hypothetical protein